MVVWGKEYLTAGGGKQGPDDSRGRPILMVSLNVTWSPLLQIKKLCLFKCLEDF